ncbi:MAG: glycosyltransferase family 2 protein [Magnetococcales bacterium]|nr:glycosyltransferase family 2 protein [Magnetococcales bacterium]
MTRMPLSVVIITKNAASVLEPCLESILFADEIVIVDSGSQDQTLELAWKYNARTCFQSWLGFGPQKRFAVTRAKHDWVLCLDADERVTPRLRTSILEVLQHPNHYAYRFPRRNRFLGRWLAHGEGYPDFSLRLFHRHHATWSLDPIHEKVETSQPVGQLAGDLLHESEQTLADYLTKQNLYTSLQADRLYALGRPIPRYRIILSPLVRFIRFYFFRLGFLDGLPGLIHIALGTCNSFVKYAKAYAKFMEEQQHP